MYSSWTVHCGVERTGRTDTHSLEPHIRGADFFKIHVFGVRKEEREWARQSFSKCCGHFWFGLREMNPG